MVALDGIEPATPASTLDGAFTAGLGFLAGLATGLIVPACGALMTMGVSSATAATAVGLWVTTGAAGVDPPVEAAED